MSTHHRLKLVGVVALTLSALSLDARAAEQAAPSPEESERAQRILAPSVPQAVSLTPQAAEALRRKVLVQCGLAENQRDDLPWYFHFEYGRALLETGDARRAVSHLTQSVELKPDPRAEERMYGMWFVEYQPYYRLADAHARLGNWPCAASAMQLSHTTGEDKFESLDTAAYQRLDRAIEANANASSGCNKRDYYDPDFVERQGDRG
jgi:hypothetical protein